MKKLLLYLEQDVLKTLQTNKETCSARIKFFLRIVKEDLPGFKLHVDFSKGESSNNFSGLFQEEDLIGMLVASDFEKLNQISPFLVKIANLFAQTKSLQTLPVFSQNILINCSLWTGNKWIPIGQKKIWKNSAAASWLLRRKEHYSLELIEFLSRAHKYDISSITLLMSFERLAAPNMFNRKFLKVLTVAWNSATETLHTERVPRLQNLLKEARCNGLRKNIGNELMLSYLPQSTQKRQLFSISTPVLSRAPRWTAISNLKLISETCSIEIRLRNQVAKNLALTQMFSKPFAKMALVHCVYCWKSAGIRTVLAFNLHTSQN